MREIVVEPGFESFRRQARELVARRVEPSSLRFVLESSAPDLFGGGRDDEPVEAAVAPVNVPRQFFPLAEHVAHHSHPSRYTLLYRLLYRLAWHERHLLEVDTDDDVLRCRKMQREVERDVEKTRAFVRFSETHDDEGPLFVAYHPTRHPSLPLSAPFFARRFSDMRWALFTPFASASFDKELRYGPGGSFRDAPPPDELEALFREYYRATFNPARVKLATMRQHMPQHYWTQLQETRSVDDMVREAPARVQRMNETAARLARIDEGVVPERAAPLPLASLHENMRGCRACPLYEPATQVVPGEGPERARLVLVGEQPGDEEDLSGRPFVGPSGGLLDEVIERAGLNRDEVYLTNAVKHFSFVTRGKIRMHQQPRPSEVAACRPWLMRELERIEPVGIVCLGVTAARSVLGATVRLRDVRGRPLPIAWARFAMATWHPAAILRAGDEEERALRYDELLSDLSQARALVERPPLNRIHGVAQAGREHLERRG